MWKHASRFFFFVFFFVHRLIDPRQHKLFIALLMPELQLKSMLSPKVQSSHSTCPQNLKPLNSSQAGLSRNRVIQSCIWKYKFKLCGLFFLILLYFCTKIWTGFEKVMPGCLPSRCMQKDTFSTAKYVYWGTTKPKEVPRPQLVLSLLLQGFGTTLLTALLSLNLAR